MIRFLRFVQIMLGALVVGSMFCIRMGFDQRGLTYAAYVQEQQEAIRGLNVLMPVLGGCTILCTLMLAYLQRTWRSQLLLLLAAAILFIVAGLVTRLGNQPINAIVMTWTSTTAPDGWEQLRADWWHYHGIRLVSVTLGFALIVLAALRGQ